MYTGRPITQFFGQANDRFWPIADGRHPSPSDRSCYEAAAQARIALLTIERRLRCRRLDLAAVGRRQQAVAVGSFPKMAKAAKSVCRHGAIVGYRRGQEGWAVGVEDFGPLIGRAWQPGSSRRHRPAERWMDSCNHPPGERLGKNQIGN